MKQLMEALKSARKIEILIIAAMLCVLLVLGLNGEWIQTDSGSEEERRMQRILSEIEGAGHVSVMIAEDESGAVVVSSGAEDIRVVLELQRAVRVLTGLELEQIEIVKSKR